MKNITITILSILLIITGGYLLYDKVLMEEKPTINNEEINKTYIEGNDYEELVKKLQEQGAKILVGGYRDKNYYSPTILVDVTPDMTISGAVEIMGPVFPIIEFEDLNTAIDIVNASPYGLASSIITNNINTAFKATKCLKTGTVIVNGSTNYRSNEMAYGGWKYSGFGTEGVSSTLEQLSLVKTIVLKNVLE